MGRCKDIETRVGSASSLYTTDRARLDRCQHVVPNEKHHHSILEHKQERDGVKVKGPLFGTTQVIRATSTVRGLNVDVLFNDNLHQEVDCRSTEESDCESIAGANIASNIFCHAMPPRIVLNVHLEIPAPRRWPTW